MSTGENSNLLLGGNPDQSFSRLLGRIVHDFNNPLAAIIGFADLLKNPNLPPEKRERYVTRVYEQAVKLSQLVENMAFFSAIPAPVLGRMPLSRTLADVCSLRTGGFQGLGIELRTGVANGEVDVVADRSAVARILHSLLNNAEQVFKENPSVERKVVELRFRSTSEGGQIDIADSGTGVPDEIRERIFEPFFTTRRSGGLGLGLTVSRGLARQMGGNLELLDGRDAALGGAVFRITLPLV
jgi:signal transduction histidine kinase